MRNKNLKKWKDAQGRELYRLGDLDNDVRFKLTDDGPCYMTYTYPRSTHTGKRQCMNMSTCKVEYLFCSKKVIVSEYIEN